jgi:hypothetical protein
MATGKSSPTTAPGGQAARARSLGSTLWVVLRIGLIAGTFDITENIIFNAFRGITPKMIFQYIASGLIGIKAALGLGIASVALGVGIHYFIATSWTAVYYAASRQWRVLVRRPVIQRNPLWRVRLYRDELHRPAPDQDSAFESSDDTGVAHQRRPGAALLHRADDCAAREAGRFGPYHARRLTSIGEFPTLERSLFAMLGVFRSKRKRIHPSIRENCGWIRDDNHASNAEVDCACAGAVRVRRLNDPNTPKAEERNG